MKRDEILIQVCGTASSGKSTIQLLIADALRDLGFYVQVNSKDHSNELNMRKNLSDARIKGVVDRVETVTIEEVQTKRRTHER